MKITPGTLPVYPKPETTSVRWSDEDWRLIAALRKKTGIRNVADLLRKALRDCAAKEGVK